MEPANAAIYFEPEGYTTSGAKLMGRQAAGEGFLRGFVRHAGVRPLYGYGANRAAADVFARLCREHGAEEGAARWLPQLAAVREAGTLYLPGPCLGEYAWRRQRLGARAFSLCGVTHTIASHVAMDCLVECQTAPVQPWDAVICTSQQVRDSVRRLWDANGAYLRERFQARAVPEPHLALIPLGVDCDALAPDPGAGRQWRERLGIGARDVVFLFLGRLSFHAKANPYPMFVALERAAARAPARLHLIQAGWFANDTIARGFREAAGQLCPSVITHYLDGRKSEVRRGIWHAADVFVSLPDNIQETFGLTPVEAMAAGLPTVVSDWDGYRDTVRDGVDGFRIPTLMAPAPAGDELAARHEDGRDTYDRYIGYASQFVAVDIAACAEACARLAGDGALRRRMGAAARERARAEFDWSVIVRRYLDLWRDLGRAREAAANAAPARGAPPNPRRADPYWLFAGYPTTVLGPACVVRLCPGAGPGQLRPLAGSALIEYAKAVHPAEDLCRRLMEQLSRDGPCAVSALMQALAPAGFIEIARAVAWLHKLGLLEVSDPAQGTTPGPRRDPD